MATVSSVPDLLSYICQSNSSDRWKHLSSILEGESIRTVRDLVGLGELEMTQLEFNLGEKIRFRRYQGNIHLFLIIFCKFRSNEWMDYVVSLLLERLNALPDVTVTQKNSAIRILNQNPHLVPSWCMLDEQDLNDLVVAHGPDA
eukprot:TRINITY_DN2890_c0_g1_i2.p1 TRINITY_DN2890_c0_g1~~TRINITY_DN2890_c0_g1_i2.p1  ORF type:complete len:144 (-),score=28.72 TRINITY_DN2890_c0_g1_i2:194-625(-)